MSTQARALPPLHTLTATAALEAMAGGELTSVSLCEALIARRRAVDGAIGAFVQTRDEALLEEAHAADQARARGDVPLGPLHGLPISIKDNVDVAGTDATLGMRARLHAPAKQDAVLVRALREAGALVLGKTNVPQLLLAIESDNAVFGRTNNPFDTGRSPGGSSGGEAAAIASGASLLGIGTDIGGSIRIPAHFCGIAGLKPSLDRWSNRGSQTAIPGQELVRAQIGPLARSVHDLAMLWRALDPRSMATRDPAVAPLAAGDPSLVDVAKLRVGVFCDDGFLAPAASVRRALERAVEALEAAGATVIEHRPQPTDEILFLWLGAISADGGRTIDRALQGEPVSAALKPSRALMRLPSAVRRTLALGLERIGEGRLARLLRTLGEKGVDDIWAMTARRTAMRLAELDAWDAAGIDLVVCPPYVLPAVPHGESADFTLALGAQFRWTLLNLPAGVAPVTTVEARETGRYDALQSGGGGDRIARKLGRLDEGTVGLPLGVQVVGRPWREDVVLAAMACIEDHARQQPGFPHTPVGRPG